MNIKILSSNQGFTLLGGINRKVKGSQVTKLAESIMRMGCIRPVVVATLSFITGKSAKYIIDGQHLYNALLRLNLPVPYIEIDIRDEEDLINKIALLNASSKSWIMEDYITAWSFVKPVYRTLNSLYDRYDIELSILVSILMDLEIDCNVGGGRCLKHVKRGEFEIVNENRSKKLLDYLTDVFKIIQRLDRQQNKFVCAEFIKMFRMNENSYNHNRFISNLKKNKDKFVLATHGIDTLSKMFKKLI